MTARTAPQTLAQKIIARAAGRDAVTPGEIVICKVDLAMMHDSGGPRRVKPLLEKLGAKVWDPDKVVVITDHYLPANDDESRRIIRIAREWVQEAGVTRFHDGIGICHVVLPQKGYLRPGMFAIGGDSHSPTGGAFGTYMFGVGATEMLGVLVTGEIWLRVPDTILVEWSGRLGPALSAKDMMLALCGKLGLDGGQYQAVQYTGEAIAALPMQERMTLCNMAPEVGAQTGLVAPDEVTRAWLQSAGATGVDVASWQGDPDAPVLAHHRFDAGSLEPQVAAPHSPANAAAVAKHAGTRIDTAYIGACTGAKIEDLRMAANILRGKRVADGVRFVVAPATAQDQATAAGEGTLQTLVDAGAELLANSCGICAGYGADRLGENEVAITSTARNFKGRMGAASSQVYLASPYTVAASAITGRICDPREFLQ
jgi:3-isopropylmalate/(R)-2-methylmalate dehydratase large subunit